MEQRRSKQWQRLMRSKRWQRMMHSFLHHFLLAEYGFERLFGIYVATKDVISERFMFEALALQAIPRAVFEHFVEETDAEPTELAYLGLLYLVLGGKDPGVTTRPGIEAKVMQCRATSKQSGKRCKRSTHPGATVCVMHGAGTRAAKASAARRLAEAALPAAEELARIIRQGEGDHVRVKASVAVLDRSGHGPTHKVDVSVSNLAEAIGTLTDEQAAELATVLEGE